jgi:hypothetical protein
MLAIMTLFATFCVSSCGLKYGSSLKFLGVRGKEWLLLTLAFSVKNLARLFWRNNSISEWPTNSCLIVNHT